MHATQGEGNQGWVLLLCHLDAVLPILPSALIQERTGFHLRWVGLFGIMLMAQYLAPDQEL